MEAAPETTWLLVRISPLALTMMPDAAPPEDPKRLVESTVSMVTTEGLAVLKTSTIACVCVRLVSCPDVGWLEEAGVVAAGAAVAAACAGVVIDTTAYVPAADSDADTSAATRTSGIRMRPEPFEEAGGLGGGVQAGA